MATARLIRTQLLAPPESASAEGRRLPESSLDCYWRAALLAAKFGDDTLDSVIAKNWTAFDRRPSWFSHRTRFDQDTERSLAAGA